MEQKQLYTVFDGHKIFARGLLEDVVLKMKRSDNMCQKAAAA